MRAAFALANVKRHAPVTRAHAISCAGGAHKWRRIHVSRPQLEGNVRHDGQSGRQIGGAGKGLLSGLVEALCRDFRQHDEEELTKMGARTLYLNMPEVELADRMCGGYCKPAKRLTSREVRLIVDYLGEPPGSPQLPNNM